MIEPTPVDATVAPAARDAVVEINGRARPGVAPSPIAIPALGAVPVEPTPPHATLSRYRPPLLFEVAWEACNQIGGIYQVLRSKVPAMNSRWGDRYFLVGPENDHTAAVEFEPQTPGPLIAGALRMLEAEGIHARYGRWLISGRPRIILLDPRLPPGRLGLEKYFLWADHGLEIPDDPLIDAVAGFAHGVYRLLDALATQHPSQPIIAHCHEWMGGLAIPKLRRAGVPVATVFTTHATILGRYVAPHRDRFYDDLPHLDPAAEAERYQVAPIHAVERACAHGAHVFTTVSEVTGEECRHLLGRAPDVILPNGLNIERYDVKHRFQTHHVEAKAGIHRFVRSHFFPYYPFDLDKTLYFFTAGRFEPRNKGFNLCLEAMARLNAEIKAAGLDVTVVFFVITQRGGAHINGQCLRSRGIIRELQDTCDAITRQVGERLFDHVTAGKSPQLDDLVDEYWRLRLKRTLHAWRRTGRPPVCTHDLDDAGGDPVLSHIRGLWLDNAPDQAVKVVYHPEFLTVANPIWKLDYDEFVRGCHLGVFPSAYEPWGYTPLECLAHGVPAITSDLAGFGRFVQTHCADHDDWGAYVVRRLGRSFDESAAELAARLLAFCRLDRRGRVALRNAANDNADAFDWPRLIEAYDEAHMRARVALTVAVD